MESLAPAVSVQSYTSQLDTYHRTCGNRLLMLRERYKKNFRLKQILLSDDTERLQITSDDLYVLLHHCHWPTNHTICTGVLQMLFTYLITYHVSTILSCIFLIA